MLHLHQDRMVVQGLVSYDDPTLAVRGTVTWCMILCDTTYGNSNLELAPTSLDAMKFWFPSFLFHGAISHTNSALGMANHLRKQGHRTCFLYIKPFASKIKQFGHEVYDCLTPDLTESPDDGSIPHVMGDIVLNTNRHHWIKESYVDTMESMYLEFIPAMLDDYTDEYDENVARKMELLEPDLLVIDHFFIFPALYKLQIPFVVIHSLNPLALHNEEDGLPEPFLGMPTNWDRNNSVYREWIERSRKARRKFHDMSINRYWTSHGFPDLSTDAIDWWFPKSHLCTKIYMCAKELDYEQPPTGWEQFDCSIRNHTVKKFAIPEKLKNKPGKLIYLSIGSLACADVVLMKRFTSMLADCPHRFLVVTGRKGDEYELPDNMWGDKFLPQLDILPVIDLIITHGGNNTITEALYFGVPAMIVCPLFGDQPDNAQRIQEKGLGIRLHPYHCTKQQLHGAIEELLNRPGLRERMRAISERMQSPDIRDKPLRFIDDFVRKHS